MQGSPSSFASWPRSSLRQHICPNREPVPLLRRGRRPGRSRIRPVSGANTELRRRPATVPGGLRRLDVADHLRALGRRLHDGTRATAVDRGEAGGAKEIAGAGFGATAACINPCPIDLSAWGSFTVCRTGASLVHAAREHRSRQPYRKPASSPPPSPPGTPSSGPGCRETGPPRQHS
jgi:hypothetical protein